MSQALIKPVEPAPGSRRPLGEIVAELGYTPDWQWSWDNYKALVTRLSKDWDLVRHLDIGGGRDPLFAPQEARALGLQVTLNDISAQELARAPAEYEKIHCDIAASDTMRTIAPESFDLVYSRMVMEHVRDARQLWANQHAMLAPGGVALAFMPTLYAPAFALNHAIPEAVSGAIVKRLFPDRHEEGDNPKFPAFYDLCFGDERKVAPVLREIGFAEVLVLPFWGYSYFWKIPGLKQIDAAFTRLSRARDWRALTSFAYIIGVKGR
jgi:SAM-dependent methyltransferase